MRIMLQKQWRLFWTSLEPHSRHQWQLWWEVNGLLRYAQMPWKTEGLATLLAVYLFAECTKKNRSSFPAWHKGFCWKPPMRYCPNIEMWGTKAQRLPRKIWSIPHTSLFYSASLLAAPFPCSRLWNCSRGAKFWSHLLRSRNRFFSQSKKRQKKPSPHARQGFQPLQELSTHSIFSIQNRQEASLYRMNGGTSPSLHP